MQNKRKLLIAILINLTIFVTVNIMCNMKYEQVDDFIIYNLYSGLDGTYNIHGVYIHPVICFILGLFFRVIPTVNWHSIFLLSIQFICFTSIGYIILKKSNDIRVMNLYIICDSIFYSTLLIMIQYTSVAALALLTSFLLLIDMIEQKENKSTKYKFVMFMLFAIGIMIRIQTIFIIIPFMAAYILVYILKYIKNRVDKDKLIIIIKYYLIMFLTLVIIYTSSLIMYRTNHVYKEYTEYNNVRTILHDIVYVDYNENKEIFDEIGWSKNDHHMFYSFNFGDENIYSKEKLEKILKYVIEKNGVHNVKFDIIKLGKSLISEQISIIPMIFLTFIIIFIISISNKNTKVFKFLVLCVTISVHLIFIAIDRSLLRVIVPEYILGTFLLLYDLELKDGSIKSLKVNNIVITILMVILLTYISDQTYGYDYKLKDYQSTRDVIEYTNKNKQNVYLYTVPSLQSRYLAYDVYQMPPTQSFSNLRVIGGWDMYTQNYMDFKTRYNLDGTLLDLLNDNVYLIDGSVVWSGVKYNNYKKSILIALKEHYNLDVQCKEIEKFDNLKIYKLYISNKTD